MTHLVIALVCTSAQAGYPVLSNTVAGWLPRLGAAADEGRLVARKQLRKGWLLTIDEVQ